MAEEIRYISIGAHVPVLLWRMVAEMLFEIFAYQMSSNGDYEVHLGHTLPIDRCGVRDERWWQVGQCLCHDGDVLAYGLDEAVRKGLIRRHLSNKEERAGGNGSKVARRLAKPYHSFLRQ